MRHIRANKINANDNRNDKSIEDAPITTNDDCRHHCHRMHSSSSEAFARKIQSER